jgi:hypothetical protein
MARGKTERRGLWFVCVAAVALALLTPMSAADAAPSRGSAVSADGALSWAAPEVVDGVPHSFHPDAVACPGQNLCVGVADGGDIYVSATPFAAKPAWSVYTLSAHRIGWFTITCPSPRLCVATGDNFEGTGYIAVSTNPAAGASSWTVKPFDDGKIGDLVSVSCPAAHRCYGVENGGEDVNNSSSWVVTTTDPGGPITAWHRVKTLAGNGGDAGLLSCPTVSRCVVAAPFQGNGHDGTVLSSDDASDPHSRWVTSQVLPPNAAEYVDSILCTGRDVCLAAQSNANANGPVRISSDPWSAHPSYRPTTISTALKVACQGSGLCLSASAFPLRGAGVPADPTDALDFYESFSCVPGGQSCAGVAGVGLITNPHAAPGRSAWVDPSVQGAGTGSIGAIACPSTQLCLIGDGRSRVVGFVPTVAAATAGEVETQAGGGTIVGISCPSPADCSAAVNPPDGGIPIVLSTERPGTPHPWTSSQVTDPEGEATDLACSTEACYVVNDDDLEESNAGSWYYVGSDTVLATAVSCASPQFCVEVGVTHSAPYHQFASATGDNNLNAAWQPDTSPNPTAMPTALSCPSTSECVATDGTGDVLVSTDGAFSWTLTKIDATHKLTGISCPSAGMCTATDNAGNVITSVNPAGGASAWVVDRVDPGHALTGISCPSVSLCVAVDGAGQGIIGTGPSPASPATRASN